MGIISRAVQERARHYSNFRGVDFSSDHTQIHPQRLAYAINMYKDYQSGQGQSLETVPGFRRRAKFGSDRVYGIHSIKSGGKTFVLVHSGTNLYYWSNYPDLMGTEESSYVQLVSSTEENGLNIYYSNEGMRLGEELISAVDVFGTTHLQESLTCSNGVLTLKTARTDLVNTSVLVKYRTKAPTDSKHSAMAERDSVSFYFNNALYIKDGKNFLRATVSGSTLTVEEVEPYVPTAYKNTTSEHIGTELEPRNLASSKFMQTFKGSNITKQFKLGVPNLTIANIVSCKIGDTALSEYTVENDMLTFTTAPLPDNDTELVVTIDKKVTNLGGTEIKEEAKSIIHECTLATTFDGRVFYSGSQTYPNHIFISRIDSTGFVNPAYVGILDYVQDGVSDSKITGMLAIGNSLCVFKEDTEGQDGSVYYHSASRALHEGYDSLGNATPVAYPYEQGLAGLGCISGACWNFVDDPVFISRLGLKGVSKMSLDNVTTLKRSIEHRSSLIDAKLVNANLKEAKLTEWNGYLVVLVDNMLFLADSRQRYEDENGTLQYEWYYLEDIGVFEGQYKAYYYSNEFKYGTVRVAHEGEEYELKVAKDLSDLELGITYDLRGKIANAPDTQGVSEEQVFRTFVEVVLMGAETLNLPVDYVIKTIGEETYALLVDEATNYIGGKFKKATTIRTLEGGLVFGTENGYVCSFNTDMRLKNGEIDSAAYSFNGRTIVSGCATIMDNCTIPHLAKSTVKRSTVIKTKSFRDSILKIKVRTNKNPYKQVARINSALFSFHDVDFGNFTFNTIEQSIFVLKEKEKQWVEKQYFIYSDEHMKPFALYSISYRYQILGRIK